MRPLQRTLPRRRTDTSKGEDLNEIVDEIE